MEELVRVQKSLKGILSLKTEPIGVKLFENVKDIPNEAELIEDCAICQAINVARYYEKEVYTTKDEAVACSMGGNALGFYELDEDMKSGERVSGLYAKDLESTKKILEGPSIDTGKFSAVVFSPLNKIDVDPEIILVYGNGDQMMSLFYAQAWGGGEKVKMITNGHGSSCRETIAAPYLEDEIRVAVVDSGERKFGLAQDYELIMGIPKERVLELIGNLEESVESPAYKRPFQPYSLFAWPESARERIGKSED